MALSESTSLTSRCGSGDTKAFRHSDDAVNIGCRILTECGKVARYAVPCRFLTHSSIVCM